MSTAMDQRLVVRRRSVREDGARRRLRRLLGVIGFVGMGALAGWLLFYSSYLSLTEVTVAGQARSEAAEILKQRGVVVGVPTVRIDGNDIERSLLADPWILAADVRVSWPGTVTVDVFERIPAGWVEAGSVWLLAAADGRVLEVAADPASALPVISVASGPTEPGEMLDATAVAGLEFVGSLPAELARSVVVHGEGEGLVAVVAGHRVELGYPTAMGEKAAALTALIGAGVPTEATIILVSPTRPAIKSQQEVETSSEDMGEAQPAG